MRAKQISQALLDIAVLQIMVAVIVAERLLSEEEEE